MKPTLVVLAAGMGSRYGGVKQIQPVGPHDEIILEYSVFDALRAGFGKVVFVLRRDIVDDFSSHVLSRIKGIETAIVLQDLQNLPQGYSVPSGREKPWGTGQAIIATEPEIHEPFAVINADDFYGADAYKVMGSYLSKLKVDQPAFGMVGYALKNTVSDFGSVSRGICKVDAKKRLVSVEEHTKIEKTAAGIVSHLPDGTDFFCSGEETVSMNLFGFTPLLFPHLKQQFKDFLSAKGQELKSEFYIPTVVNTLVQGGLAHLEVLRSDAVWFGITYREDLPSTVANIRALVNKGDYPEQLWKR